MTGSVARGRFAPPAPPDSRRASVSERRNPRRKACRGLLRSEPMTGIEPACPAWEASGRVFPGRDHARLQWLWWCLFGVFWGVIGHDWARGRGEPPIRSGAGEPAGVVGSRVAEGHRAATRSALDAIRRLAESGAKGRRFGGGLRDHGRVSDLRALLQESFRWRSDPPVWPSTRTHYADDSGWFRSAEVIAALGPALAGLHPDRPTVVMGPESKGTVLAALVAVHLGVGMAEVRKDHKRASDDDPWLTRRTGPDYRDRGLLMGVRKSQLTPGDRVLFVDDWVATGSQMAACHGLVEDGGGTWVGAALVVDALEEPSTRRRLNVRSILHVREL